MAPTDRIRLPLRWEFAPEASPRNGAVLWRWRAYTQAGKLAMQSSGAFDTFTECVEDAKANGYSPPESQ